MYINSRVDAYLGHADIFNQQAFNETRSYWGKVVNVESGTAAIIARMKTCKATNPTYSLSDLGEAFILGETAAFISILGDAQSITVDKRRVEYLFRTSFVYFYPGASRANPLLENERLPTELGWKRPSTPFTTDLLLANLEKVRLEYKKQLNSTLQRKRSGGYADRLIH
jgi:hypothetical protein